MGCSVFTPVLGFDVSRPVAGYLEVLQVLSQAPPVARAVFSLVYLLSAHVNLQVWLKSWSLFPLWPSSHLSFTLCPNQSSWVCLMYKLLIPSCNPVTSQMSLLVALCCARMVLAERAKVSDSEMNYSLLWKSQSTDCEQAFLIRRPFPVFCTPLWFLVYRSTGITRATTHLTIAK